MIQRATTTPDSLPPSKSLLHMLLKRVSASRSKAASFLDGRKYQAGHLAEFCRKCSPCFRSIAVSYSANLGFSIKKIPHDSWSSAGGRNHRYCGNDSQSGCVTQTNT